MNFYIGWQDEMPNEYKSYLGKFLVLLVALLVIASLSFVLFQKPFKDHSFELGKVIAVTGTYFNTPFPMLVAENDQLAEGISPNILLVGFGKFGAEGIMEEIQTKEGTVVVYQPQPETLKDNQLKARAAVALELKNSKEPIFGTGAGIIPPEPPR